MTGSPPARPPRPSPLTPHAALGWLRSLSIDITAAAVLDADGNVLAGDPALALAAGADAGDAAPASDAALASDAAPAGDRTGLLIARSDRHAIVARTGPKALERLTRADLQAALAALDAG
jgi:hypothetical protein